MCPDETRGHDSAALPWHGRYIASCEMDRPSVAHEAPVVLITGAAAVGKTTVAHGLALPVPAIAPYAAFSHTEM